MQTQIKQTASTEPSSLLTFEGFSLLMMVVLPLLSKPRHKTWTSFFFSPSHPASLSNNPMAVAGNHGAHLLFRESGLLEKGYMQGSAGTEGGHGAEQPHTRQRMLWAGPDTNTVPGAGSAHKHTEGKLITARRPRFQSRLAVYSPVCVTQWPWFAGQKTLPSFWAAQTGAQLQRHQGSHQTEQKQKEGHYLYLQLSAVCHSDNKTAFPFFNTCYIIYWALH